MTGKRVGLVIGNNYPDSDKQLRFAVADALAMKEVMLNKDICGFDEVIDLVDRTSKAALVEVEKILNRVDSELVFIYFSGHGKKDFENDLCLLFNDTEEDTLLATSLTFDFINKCRRYPSRKSVIIILDCCYSGAAGIRDVSDVMEALKKYSGSGTIILTSTGLTGSPAAREEEKFGHGVFTNYLIEGLEKGYADKGNGYISIEELYDYAFKKTKSEGYQSPKKEGNIEGSIFIGRNPQKIRENEYNSKKSKLLSEYIRTLHPLILNESLTVLRKAYDVPPSLESVEETIYDLLNSLLKSELQPDNYSDAVQHLKGISTSSESSRNMNKVDKSNTAVSISENKESLVNSEEPDISKTFTSLSTGMEFVLIPAGKFMMGSPSDKEGIYDEDPIHKVTIEHSFYMGKYPVTQKQWEKVRGNNPSKFKGEDQPVEMVSWEDTKDFIARLNEMEGTDKYRLPSEAEWEYSCRAGTQTRYSFGDDESKLKEYGWYHDNADSKTHPVGQRTKNPWDLYDMHGNVWEWVQDSWHNNYKGAPSDGSAWEDGDISVRVLRGGSWSNFRASECRSASREGSAEKDKRVNFGFRVVRKL
ncbi:SUMF1/EgtB/PvdO family nonheme iron enzyme [Methanosarcina sp.]|uniref:SUMF1/EgtB/PvdO family nonheme iron enzyme n=1 Tax=Methanosarcina sp. TaxID=2213 RepID=UPI0029890A0D|nr:SUMF1/EgtB/PvdO family nonheme iron enzyme [Methanosarcina sp.]MDW5549470.1 SUMF1/EgtB/PvdO family nonheme iron enzyme [Methanosarcina sp.]MDW5553504.1 SUMF1/EgtB/PvdO family nonheme iron enzyme [Methanosarcina sp.]MDW5558691.1 SUMF1/EgtB/PvdO family nonheme iron enzyme [Methanosarcina sp.]